MQLVNTYYRTGNPKSARIIYRTFTIFSNFNEVFPSLEIDVEDGVHSYLQNIKSEFYSKHEISTNIHRQ